MNDQDFQSNLGMSRRTLIKRSAVVGAGMVWATPVVQSLSGPAFAQTRGSASCTFDVIVEINGTCIYAGTATTTQDCCACLVAGTCEPGAGACDEFTYTPANPAVVVP